jgi:hypothetical protein
MSMLSHFLKHVLGRENYDAIKAQAMLSAAAVVDTKGRQEGARILEQAGLGREQAGALADQIADRIIAALAQ